MMTATTLVELLEQRAAKTPDASAYAFAEEVLTYSALRQQVSALANTLCVRGVKPGDRVGILVHRNLDMVRAVYAVLYAGAAYVPIDTTSPALRVQELADQCELSLIIASPRHKGLATVKSTSLLLVDDEWQGIVESSFQHLTPPTADLKPEDLAYIIFTSGSTGTPKGIAHSHRSAICFAEMMANHYQLSVRDILLATSALHFDMSTFDLFAADWAGSQSVIASEAHQKMPASLTGLAEKHKITVWYSAPFAMSQALEYGALEQRQLQQLRLLIYAGEAFPVQQLNRLMGVLAHCRFSNAYGPAETNVSHIYDFPWPNKPINTKGVPIGKPCDQVFAELVDKNGDIAEQGELCISANTLMSGYWRQDKLTKDRIYLGNNGRRYYRSGDIASVDKEGVFTLHGRKDRQVKLRGFRVELEEIENCLGSIADVEQVNVSIRQHKSGQQDLVADVLLRADAMLSVEELKRVAKRVLPVYAVPSDIVVRSHFPTTSSGKIDRRALSQQWQELRV